MAAYTRVCGDIALPFTNISSYIQALLSLTFISRFPTFIPFFGPVQEAFISSQTVRLDEVKRNPKNAVSYMGLENEE